MDLDTTRRFLAEHPQIRHQQATLEALEPDARCCHGSWGVGCVQSIDPENNRIVIQFEVHPEPKSMDLAFCLQKLQILPETHIIVEVRRDLKATEQLLKTDPCELVVKALQDFPNAQATPLALEVVLRQALSPFFKPDTFKHWWLSLQKKLPNAPLISVPKGANGVFSLRSDPISREHELLEALLSSKQAAQTVAFGIQLCQLPALEGIRKELPSVLEAVSPLFNYPQLTLAQRLQACWICSDIACVLDVNAEPFEQNAVALVQDSGKLPDLAKALPHTQHERLLRLLVKAYPDEWQQVVLLLLKDASSGFADTCFGCLVKHGEGKLLTDTLKSRLQSQSLNGTLLIWILRHRKVQPYVDILAPLLGTPFFMSILQVIDREAIGLTPGRRVALAEELVKDTALIGELLKDADVTAAKDLMRLLMHNQGLDDLQKRSLLARFIRVFPELQSLVEHPSGASETSDAVWVSQAGLDAAKKEYATLVNEKIPANKEAVAKARELGDLRENSEYKMARQDQTVLLARKSELEKFINRARVIRLSEVQTDRVNIGTEVTLKNDSGASVTYVILGALDSDPEKNIISYQTSMAKAMLGKSVGAKVALPNGETATVQSIRRYGV